MAKVTMATEIAVLEDGRFEVKRICEGQVIEKFKTANLQACGRSHQPWELAVVELVKGNGCNKDGREVDFHICPVELSPVPQPEPNVFERLDEAKKKYYDVRMQLTVKAACLDAVLDELDSIGSDSPIPCTTCNGKGRYEDSDPENGPTGIIKYCDCPVGMKAIVEDTIDSTERLWAPKQQPVKIEHNIDEEVSDGSKEN